MNGVLGKTCLGQGLFATGVGHLGEEVRFSTKTVAWENSREVEQNKKSFGLLPFHHKGAEIWIGPSTGMSPPGGGAEQC